MVGRPKKKRKKEKGKALGGWVREIKKMGLGKWREKRRKSLDTTKPSFIDAVSIICNVYMQNTWEWVIVF